MARMRATVSFASEGGRQTARCAMQTRCELKRTRPRRGMAAGVADRTTVNCEISRFGTNKAQHRGLNHPSAPYQHRNSIPIDSLYHHHAESAVPASGPCIQCAIAAWSRAPAHSNHEQPVAACHIPTVPRPRCTSHSILEQWRRRHTTPHGCA